MKNKHRESKLAIKIEKADRKQKIAKEKEAKPRKGSGRSSQGVRPISEDLSSQYEEAEDELERVGRGPH
ncbi:MAG: hypothetical protein JRN15_01120 [Nitrososphaerota archaeon]|jgi:hypothetical protein|nr:hypothetical protein [Nitrososphaerota archaeon]